MAKRHKDALAIQDGSCNPVAIVNSMQAAIVEIRAEQAGWDAIRQDPAFRLMVHQLDFLCNIAELDEPIDYELATSNCRFLSV
jgi:hypothetical protein